MMFLPLVLAAASLVSADPPPAVPALCSVTTLRDTPEGYHWPLENIVGFVAEADAIVRGSGQRGSCYTMEYRMGGEYLLLLEESRGELTPYWAPLAPTNEQIRGEEDPWVQWVKARAG